MADSEFYATTEAAQPTAEEQLRSINADVAEALALLADALDRGDRAAAKKYVAFGA